MQISRILIDDFHVFSWENRNERRDDMAGHARNVESATGIGNSISLV